MNKITTGKLRALIVYLAAFRFKTSRNILFGMLIMILSGIFSPAYSDTDLAGGNLTPANGDTLTGKYTNVGTFTIPSGVTVNVGAGTLLEIYANTINIEGTLNGAGRGYPAGNYGAAGGGPGGGAVVSGWAGGKGGGYGGQGGSGAPTYGTSDGTDIDMGSGGTMGIYSGSYGEVGAGGAGGAGILLKTTGNCTVSGTITANGAPGLRYLYGTGSNGGGGSGGGIYIESSGALTISGTVTANGGSPGGGPGYAGTGGGGGRIKLFSANGSIMGSTITATGVNNVGTIYKNFSTYTVTASSGANGSISPLGTTETPVGTSQAYTMTPNEGCYVTNVLVDGSSVGTVSTYTFSNIEGDTSHTIHVNYLCPTTVGNKIVHTFTASGTFVLPLDVGSSEVEYLVVGGGGGGAGAKGGGDSSWPGAGGGGGGYRSGVITIEKGQPYVITVGAGGAGGSAIGPAGKGGDSSFDSLIVAAGGGGGYGTGENRNGGSGGGGGGLGNVPETTPPQGYSGGLNPTSIHKQAPGGGGGGAAASNISDCYNGVTGGAGINKSITGVSVGYAGGGAGGVCQNVTNSCNSAYPTGTHGGGRGGRQFGYLPTPGAPNTGGGGGGGGYNNGESATNGAAGGSGIVVISYLKDAPLTITATAGENGTISPSGTTSVNSGESQIFTITPSAGYRVTDVLVDGSSVGPVSTYEFTNVTENHTISATFSINTYTITASSGDNGTISPSGATSVNHGGSQTYTIAPNESYHIADVLVDGSSVGAVSSYTFTNVSGNHTISATFITSSFTITSTAGEGGIISPSGTKTYGLKNDALDANVVLYMPGDTDFNDVKGNAVANNGSAVISDTSPYIGAGHMRFNGNVATPPLSVATSPDLTFGTSDFTFEFFAKPDISQNTYGYIMSNNINYPGYDAWTTNAWFIHNNHPTSPNRWRMSVYNIGGWILTSTSPSNTNEWTHIAIVRSGNTFMMFVGGNLEATYTSSASLDAGTGSTPMYIGGDSPSNVYLGAADELRITKRAKYTSSFTPPVYTPATYVVTPNENYHIADVLVDGSSVGAVTNYNFENITANHTISASFAINAYGITASAGENGSISPSGATSVNHGGSQAFTITPNEGYKVSDVLVDGSSVGAVSTYTFSNVTAPHTISATFATNTFAITATAGANGSISPSGTISANKGASQTFTITPNEGYHVADVLVGGVSAGAIAAYTFENIGTPPPPATIAPVAASGGTVTTVGNKTIHTFTANGTFTVPEGVTGNIEVLVVGGGGGGATGGGGGGGVIYNTSYPVSAQTYAVVVGEGGAGAIETQSPAASPAGTSGQDSAFGALVAKGGGGGGGNNAYPDNAPIVGGSGGGGGYSSISQVPGAAGTDTQGYAGGNNASYLSLPYPAGGGGGAGAAGGNATAMDVAGNGGAGLTFNITGSPVNYAGGGGGGVWGAGTAGLATHGGGAGGANALGSPGTPNSGGGGGGAGYLQSGAAGGSGVVIVSYTTADFGTETQGSYTIDATFALNTYTISATSGENGTITPSGEATVNHGGSQSYTITPSEGYRVEVVLVDGSSVGAVTEYEFANVTANHTISATFALNTHNITASASEGGSITPSGVTAVNNGGSQSYTITAGEGYYIVDVLIDGLSNGAISSYTFSNVNGSHTISATFAINTHIVSATAGDNGTISPLGEVTVNQGANQTFAITPNEGYHVVDVLVDGSSVGAVTSYNFENVTAAHTISATFAINSYNISTLSGDGGSITPSGVTTLNHGGSQSYAITASEGYHIADVLVDENSVGAVSTYEFTNVTANHTISVTFAIETYTITASAGANGSITPSGETSAESGAGQVYTITPNEGYHIADVLVDENSVGAVSTYEFTNVTANHTISVTFAINVYNITATASEGGSITPSGTVTVNHGSNQVFTMAPNGEYFIEDVLVDGVSVGTVTNYEFTNVTGNRTIAVSFTQSVHTVTATAGENGSISPVGDTTVVHGGSQGYTITPAEGYHVADVLVDGSSVGAVSTYEISGITADRTISATFAINTYTVTATAGENGSITPSGITNVEHGGSQSYTIAPDENFLIGDVTVNGSSVGVGTSYEFTNITGNSTIAATFVRPLPVIGDITCPESTYPGQAITCTATATAVNGTVAYEWAATTGEVVEQTGNSLTVKFNTSGNKLITAKAYLTEDPQRYASSNVTVAVDEIAISLNLNCPEQAVKGEPFECSVVGETPIGSLSYKWSISNGSLTEEGDKATITPDRSGTVSVKVAATLSESPAVQKEASRSVTVIFTGEVTPVIKGLRYPYINTPMTYTVEAPCITKTTCTVKIAVNGVEENSASATFSFPEPGKYTITAETTLTDNGLKKTGQYLIYAEPMPKPLIYLQGPSAAFAEETTTYSTSVAEKHKVLPVMFEWTLPDGSTSTEPEVTLSPDTGGIVYLTCKAWVDGYRETTERVLTKRINVVAYVFPLPKIYVRFPEGSAPYPVSLAARNTVKPTPGAPYRIVYNWDFGDGETLTTQKDTISHIYQKTGSYLVRMTATDHKGNVTTDEATINAGVPPLELSLKMSSSNTAMRTPLTAYIRSSITKRSSLDRLESHEWRIDDTLIEGTQPEYLRTTFTEPGEYEVLYKATMKSGTVGTKTLNVTVNPNTPPVCEIEYTDYPSSNAVILKAVCTDADGRLSSYKWDLDDGRGYRSGFTKITLPASVSRVFNIKLQATDDAGGVTEVTREISITR